MNATRPLAPSPRPVFRAEEVTRVYRTGAVEVRALRGISLNLYEGEMVVLLGASGPEVLGLVGMGLLLIAVEALNTAIEVLVDQLSPGWSAWAKEAKDLGSLAVACVIGLLLTYAAVVLIW